MIIKMEAMMLRNTHVQIEDQPIKGLFKMKLSLRYTVIFWKHLQLKESFKDWSLWSLRMNLFAMAGASSVDSSVMLGKNNGPFTPAV